MKRIGIYYQIYFPFGAFGPRDWTLAEHKRCLAWLKELGYTSVGFTFWPILKTEPGNLTMLEEVHFYHSALEGRPAFTAGHLYSTVDAAHADAQSKARSDVLRDAMLYAREIGLEVVSWIHPNISGVAFARAHPEALAVGGTDFWVDGLTLCPSHPEAMAYLRAFWGEQIERYGFADRFMFLPKDPGGCVCARCVPYGKTIARLFQMVREEIDARAPGKPLDFLSWHVLNEEVPDIRQGLPVGTVVYEAARIHAMNVPLAKWEERIRMWQEMDMDVHAYAEIQENPTALLPSAYPKRIGKVARLARKHGCTGILATSMQNPYLFPMHLAILPRIMREPERDPMDLAAAWLGQAYGKGAVAPGLAWIEANEEAWDHIQAPSQYEAGFVWPFVTFWGHGMLPAQLIQKGMSPQAEEDLRAAEAAAMRASEAAERLADAIRPCHALDANVIAVYGEILALRTAMRAAKIPVVRALHEGDAATACEAWKEVLRLCRELVAAARNAPNTEVLLHHWRKIERWPERLEVVGEQFAELAATKRYRPISPSITTFDMWKKEGET